MTERAVRLWALAMGLAVVPLTSAGCAPGTESSGSPGSRSYLFCFWNVENLFDDQDDGRTQAGDREFDRWFSHDPQALHLKLAHLSDALVKLNGGRGPDILAVVEIESVRAAELLRDALNSRLGDPALQYSHVLMKELSAGRHIAPAIITRLPVRGGRTRLHGRRQRILEGHIDVEGNDLVVIASHWTSRLTDKDGRHRDGYGDEIHGLFRAMYRSNSAVDVVVCGDFNDPPDAPSVVRHLRSTGDVDQVRRDGDNPFLLNLFAGKDPLRSGTHYAVHRWFIFDQILISPGMLDDRGWTCDPGSAQVVNALYRPGDRLRRPWRFGSERDRSPRGYSDHFPVTVELRVAGR